MKPLPKQQYSTAVVVQSNATLNNAVESKNNTNNLLVKLFCIYYEHLRIFTPILRILKPLVK